MVRSLVDDARHVEKVVKLADRERKLEIARRAVRLLFAGIPPRQSEDLPFLGKGFTDVGIAPCRELLILRNARDEIIYRSASKKLSEDDRVLIFSEERLVIPLERHLLNLSVSAKWSKFELDMQRLASGEVRIVALAKP
jgi:hypothetical protein